MALSIQVKKMLKSHPLSTNTTFAMAYSSTRICTDGKNKTSEWHVEFQIPELNTFFLVLGDIDN